MDDIGRAILPLLKLVLDVGVVHGPVDEGRIRAGQVLGKGVGEGGVVGFKGFHDVQLSFGFKSRCMVRLVLRSAFWGPGVRVMEIRL